MFYTIDQFLEYNKKNGQTIWRAPLNERPKLRKKMYSFKIGLSTPYDTAKAK